MISDSPRGVASIIARLASAWFLASASLMAPSLGAQSPGGEPPPTRWSVDLRIGYANATGDLGDLSDEGFHGAVGVSYRVTPRLALRSDVGSSRLRRAGRPRELGGIVGPKTLIWHFLGGVELELTGDDATPWNVWTGLGAGASTLDVSGTLDGGMAVPEMNEWKPTVGLSLMLGYRFAGSLNLFARSEALLLLGDRTSPDEFLGKEAVMASSVGLRLSI